MNNNGILLPPIASDEEVQALRQSSQLNVERINSKFTAIGNLIAANDNGAIVSPLFRREADRQVQDVLGVLTHSMTVGGFVDGRCYKRRRGRAPKSHRGRDQAGF
jgi:translation initiation factor 6